MPLIQDPNNPFSENSDPAQVDAMSPTFHLKKITDQQFGVMRLFNHTPRLGQMGSEHNKLYSRAEKVTLPEIEETELSRLQKSRRSTRRFSETALNLKEVSSLLRGLSTHTGRSRVVPELNTELHYRSNPSGGARYPIEIYVIPRNVDGLQRKVHHYEPLSAQLSVLNVELSDDQICDFNFASREETLSTPLIVLMTAMPERTTVKYGERSWRFIYLEAGHLGQNLWLTATDLGLGCVATGGGFDYQIAKALKLNLTEETFVYALRVGKV